MRDAHTGGKIIFPGRLSAAHRRGRKTGKSNLSLAIRVVTIAELVGAVSGIGYGLVLAQELFSVADVFAWTLVLVVTLFIAEGVVNAIEKRMLRWRT